MKLFLGAGLISLLISACGGPPVEPVKTTPSPTHGSISPGVSGATENDSYQASRDCEAIALAEVEDRYGLQGSIVSRILTRSYFPQTDLYRRIESEASGLRREYGFDQPQDTAEPQLVSEAEHFISLSGESVYVNPAALDATRDMHILDGQCIRDRGFEPVGTTNNYGPISRCATEAVWMTWLEYGGASAFDFTDDFMFVLVVVEDRTELLVTDNDAREIAVDYETRLGKSAYSQREAIAFLHSNMQSCLELGAS